MVSLNPELAEALSLASASFCYFVNAGPRSNTQEIYDITFLIYFVHSTILHASECELLRAIRAELSMLLFVGVRGVENCLFNVLNSCGLFGR